MEAPVRDAPRINSQGDSFRKRMKPRFDAWNKTRPSRSLPAPISAEIPNQGIYDRAKTGLKRVFSNKSSKAQVKSQIKIPQQIAREDAYLRDSDSKSLPIDVVRVVLSFVNLSSLRALRATTKKWNVLIENESKFWLLQEAAKFYKEVPLSILRMFGQNAKQGAINIRNIQFISLNSSKFAERFKPKTGPDLVVDGETKLSLAESTQKRLTWITPQLFEGKNVMRGIDPYGCHYICLRVLRIDQSKAHPKDKEFILVLQEDAPAFRSLRPSNTFGWVASTLDTEDNIHPLYGSHGPLGTENETICIIDKGVEHTKWSEDTIKKMNALLKGEKIVNVNENTGSRLVYRIAPDTSKKTTS